MDVHQWVHNSPSAKHSPARVLMHPVAWEDNENRDSFYGGSLGVGIMMYFLAAPPKIYGFTDELPEAMGHGVELHLHHFAFSEPVSPGDRLLLQNHWLQKSSHRPIFCGWELDTSKYTPEEYTTQAKTCLALTPPTPTATPSQTQHMDMPLVTPNHHHTHIALYKPYQPHHPCNPIIRFPHSTPALLQTPPWTYGKPFYDDSKIGDAAFPHGVEFRPMATLGHSGWFPYEPPSEIEPEPEPESESGCQTSILTVFLASGAETADDGVIPQLCRLIGIQPGLRQLFWGRDESDERIVRFFIG